jgi:SAM-dependent methyltransferase
MYRVRRTLFTRLLRRVMRDFTAPDVLDIGSGTGFYIRMWEALGAGSITGLDITETAVTHLRARFPRAAFHCCDIGADDLPLRAASYDIITAGEILFHIVDDTHFAMALTHAARLLRPGGCFVFTDYFPHAQAHRTDTMVCRTLPVVEALLAERGLIIERRAPVFTLMSTPLDTGSRFLRFLWKAQHAVVSRVPALGTVAGALLYPLELLLAGILREGPSLEVMVCRKPR